MKLTMLQQLRNSQKLTSEIQALGHAKVKLEIQLKETRLKSQDEVRTLKSFCFLAFRLIIPVLFIF